MTNSSMSWVTNSTVTRSRRHNTRIRSVPGYSAASRGGGRIHSSPSAAVAEMVVRTM